MFGSGKMLGDAIALYPVLLLRLFSERSPSPIEKSWWGHGISELRSPDGMTNMEDDKRRNRR
ncbi:MAG TPA: hypothetical protein V6D20_09475 [Candidatus Obscuribacterales bacterium]